MSGPPPPARHGVPKADGGGVRRLSRPRARPGDRLAVTRQVGGEAAPRGGADEPPGDVALFDVGGRVVEQFVVDGAEGGGAEDRAGLDGLLGRQGDGHVGLVALELGDDPVDGQERQVEGAVFAGDAPPVAVPHGVPAVDDAGPGALHHPGDLVRLTAPPVQGGDRCHRQRADAAGPPPLLRYGLDAVLRKRRCEGRVTADGPGGGEARDQFTVVVVGVEMGEQGVGSRGYVHGREGPLGPAQGGLQRLDVLQRVDQQPGFAQPDLDSRPPQAAQTKGVGRGVGAHDEPLRCGRGRLDAVKGKEEEGCIGAGRYGGCTSGGTDGRDGGGAADTDVAAALTGGVPRVPLPRGASAGGPSDR